MFNQLRPYFRFVFCALLLNIALLSSAHLMATQEVQSQNEVVQSAENDEQTDEKEIKKPTFTQSWCKVVTLRWKELSKADAWNIGALLAGIAVFGLLYRYFPKDINADNVNNNPGQNNPGADLGDLDFDSSSDDDSNNDPGNSILIGLNNELLPEVQTKIASYRYEEFLKKSIKKDMLMIDKLNAKDEAIVREAIYTEDDRTRELRKCDRKSMIYELVNRYLDHAQRSLIFKWQFYSLIEYNLTIPQVDLIEHAWNALRKNQPFTIYCLSEDGKVFLTFDKTVRMFLLEALAIDLKMEKGTISL